jgi:chromosome segregation ATPase
MNSKGKVWQIVLLALLVLAIIAILLFNNKLNASKESLSSTMAQLTQEQNNSAALQKDLDAARAEYEAASAELEKAKAQVGDLNAQVESGKATAEQLQADLTAANAQVTALETEVAETKARVTELENLVSRKDTAIALMSSLSSGKDSVIEGLNSSLNEKDSAIKGLNETISEKDAAIEDLYEAITEKDTAIEGMSGMLTEKDAIIEGLNSTIIEKDATIGELTAGASLETDEAEAGATQTEAGPETTAEPESQAEPEPQADPEPEAEPEPQAEPDDVQRMAEAAADLERTIMTVASLQSQGEDVPEGVADIDLDAVREEMTAIVGDTSGDTTEEERIEALTALRQDLEASLPEAEQAVADAQAMLDAAGAEVERLTAMFLDKMGDVIALNEAMEELDAQAASDAEKLATMQSQLEQAEAEITTWQKALEEAQAEVAANEQAYQQAMEEAKTEYEANLAQAEAETQTQKEALEEARAEIETQKEALEEAQAETEAYKLDRELESGDAHMATEVDSDIRVAADGVTAVCQYTNSDTSGNAVSVALMVDGETVFTRTLKPGESLDGFTLEKPLAAGNYDAMVVTTVKDTAGETVMTTRMPVTISVAAE